MSSQLIDNNIHEMLFLRELARETKCIIGDAVKIRFHNTSQRRGQEVAVISLLGKSAISRIFFFFFTLSLSKAASTSACFVYVLRCQFHGVLF